MSEPRASETVGAGATKGRGLARAVADRAKRLSRLFAYLSVVCLALAFLAARSVWGDVQRASLAVGDELGRLGEVGEQRTIRLNGQPIRIASSTEDVPLEQLLDQFEAYCRAHTSGLGEGFEALPAEVKAELGARGERAAAGVMRVHEGTRGVVACLVRPEGRGEGGLADLVERVGALTDTGDLSTVGNLRYLHAKRTAKGRTHVVLAWTDGPFRVDALVPEAGDAPGSDPIVGPRPPGSTRFFSAAVDGVPYGVRLYDAAAAPEQVMRDYHAALLDRGYQLLANDPSDPNARAYAHPEGDLWVTISETEGRSLVSVLEIAGRKR